MASVTNIEQFRELDLGDRTNIFDATGDDFAASASTTELYNLLKTIILDRDENSYVRKRAIETLTESVFVDRLKPRHGLSVLMDEWGGPDETFVEVQRVKDLFLLYESVESEVEAVFLSALSHPEAEVRSEGSYRIGLTHLQRALQAKEESEAVGQLQEAKSAFVASHSEIENRIDAQFFLLVCDYLVQLLNGHSDIAAPTLAKLGQIIFEFEAFSFAKGPAPLLVGFHRALDSLQRIRWEDVSNWLDYRAGFDRLHFLVNEIQSAELMKRLNDGALHAAFATFLSERVLHPYYAKSFSSEISRIDARLAEQGLPPELVSFLTELKNLAGDEDLKKKIEVTSFREKLIKALPARSTELINAELAKVKDQSPHEYMEVFERLSVPSPSTFLDDLVWACIVLQKDRMYVTASENDRNTQIANLLEGRGYRVKDQTLRGITSGGKSAGELDIFVENGDGLPFSLIEALILNSLNKAYISLHLDKIFSYDTVGIRDNNFILVYSESKNLDSLWTKYVEFVKGYEFPFPLVSVAEKALYAGLRIARGIHNRNGLEVALSHIMVNLRPNSD